MELNEIRNKSKEYLSNFINRIGLDGDYYTSTNNCAISWGTPKLNSNGEFVTPYSERLENIIKSLNYDSKTEESLRQNGLILINSKYKMQPPNADLYVTVIHEMLHANRSLLLKDYSRTQKNESAYTVNDNEKIDLNTSNTTVLYADASQDILKGNIDTSNQSIKKYSNKSSNEIENTEYISGNRDSKMEKQQIVDEGLVELMSILAYKTQNSDINIWDELNKIISVYDKEDIGILAKIIVKHHDFELFNWMLDPIGYSQGDIHYDFFSKYTKNDDDLVNDLYNTDILNINNLIEDISLDRLGNKKVNISCDKTQEILNKIKNNENIDNTKNNNIENNNIEKEI